MRFENIAVFCGHVLRIVKELKVQSTHHAFPPLELAQCGLNAPIAAFLSTSCIYAALPARVLTLTSGGGSSNLLIQIKECQDGHFHALHAVDLDF